MSSKAAKATSSLSLDQIFQAIQCIKTNASELIRDAELLANAGRFARSYSLAYCAREELSKLFILLEASWKSVRGAPLDWQSFWVEMNDHHAKANQFVLTGRIVKQAPGTLSAAWNTLLTMQLESIPEEGSSAFKQRNDGLYCDIDETGQFRLPSEVLSREAACALIASAKADLELACSYFDYKSSDDFRKTTERVSAKWLRGLFRSAELFNKFEDGSISEEEHDELYKLFSISASAERTEVLRISRRHAGVMYSFLIGGNISRRRGRRRARLSN